MLLELSEDRIFLAGYPYRKGLFSHGSKKLKFTIENFNYITILKKVNKFDENYEQSKIKL